MDRKPPHRGASFQQSWVAAPSSGPASSTVAVEATLAAAIQNLRAGKLQQAEALYRKVLEMEPNHPIALHLLGAIMHQAGKIELAVDLIGKAIAVKPDYGEAHNNLGNVLAAQGRLEEATTCYQKAVALNPNFAETHSNLGAMLSMQGKPEEAVAAYRKAIALNPDLAEVHNNLGFVLQDLGELEEALASIGKAIALMPNYAEAHGNLGRVLAKQGRFEGAVAALEKAIALRPDFPEAHCNLGNALKSLGKLDEAVAALEKAITLKPDFSGAHNSLGNALKTQGKLDEAVASYRRAMEIEPDYVSAHYNHASAHKFIPGDPEIENLRKLLEQKDISEDNRVMLLFALGKAHDDIGLYAEAFSYYSVANNEKAKRVNFDASRHRQEILETKRVFRARYGFAGENSRDVDYVPIFAVGMSRSGKSLVESLLSQHEAACGAGENRAWFYAVEEVIDKYSITKSFQEYMGVLSDDHIREIGITYMGNLLKDSPNSKLFINTLPGNYRFIGMILQALPMAKIIYCHRDPIDNCLFVYFYRYRSGNDYSYDLSNLVSFYIDYQELMAHWQGLYGDRILNVRYEELVRNPADSGARIFGFCGLDYDPTAIRHAFTTDEIDHWKNYEPYLDTLRQALGRLAL